MRENRRTVLDSRSSEIQRCCGGAGWSDCTARAQTMGGRRIKRAAVHRAHGGHEVVEAARLGREVLAAVLTLEHAVRRHVIMIARETLRLYTCPCSRSQVLDLRGHIYSLLRVFFSLATSWPSPHCSPHARPTDARAPWRAFSTAGLRPTSAGQAQRRGCQRSAFHWAARSAPRRDGAV
jgi:hypothetical protein